MSDDSGSWTDVAIIYAGVDPDSALFDRFPTAKNAYVAAVVFESVLYGFYLALCLLYTYISLTRHTKPNVILLLAAIAMFAVSTTDIVYTYILLFRDILSVTLTFRQLYPKYMFYVTCSTLADMILLYRCFVIWGHNLYILVSLGLFLSASTACGYIVEGTKLELFHLSFVYLCMIVAFNVIVTGLSAGRIWWVRRGVKATKDMELSKRCERTVAFLIETGILYSTYIVVVLICSRHLSLNAILDAGLIQVVVIMPTLIMVQVALHPNHLEYKLTHQKSNSADSTRPLMASTRFCPPPV
ncbi:hypothetical protein BDN72DRAFT_572014 [Pluteus cervinus]|uniref:Uncharacterized protein n=1 Tax=Pluteus cervinus TaxID=181527 RepID=A0ACD3AW41_9AGAR|nr:hypothetical protein BDN72DRAFT_572014 [Pluteus cervinus]